MYMLYRRAPCNSLPGNQAHAGVSHISYKGTILSPISKAGMIFFPKNIEFIRQNMENLVKRIQTALVFSNRGLSNGY